MLALAVALGRPHRLVCDVNRDTSIVNISGAVLHVDLLFFVEAIGFRLKKISLGFFLHPHRQRLAGDVAWSPWSASDESSYVRPDVVF